MSVFRFGLVGPNCNSKLIMSFCYCLMYLSGYVGDEGDDKKGKMVNIPLLFPLEFFRWRHRLLLYSLVNCRTQQTFRVFLTNGFSILYHQN